MLAKITSKNQLTLPKSLISEFSGTEYFDVTCEQGRIILAPVRIHRADAVRSKLAQLNITEKDAQDAIQWARKRKS